MQHICIESVLDDENDVFCHLAVAGLAVSARHPAGAGDWPGDGGIDEVDEVDGQDDSEEDEDEDEKSEEDGGQYGDDEEEDEKRETPGHSPIALAHLGPDVRAKSPQGGRHPDHGSKDEESKLSHLLLSGQDKGFLRPLTAEVGH